MGANQLLGSVGAYVKPRTSWDLSGNTVAQFKCNDDAASTVATDEEGTNGTASVNTDQLSVAGKINDAFDFTAASSEYVNLNQTFQTTFRSAHSYSCWIKPNDGQPAASQFVFGSLETGGDDATTFNLRSTGLLNAYYVSDGDAVTARTAAAVFANGATSWTHVVVNISATIIDIYVNGSKVALDVAYPGDMTGATMGDWTSTKNAYLGARNNDGTDSLHFDGPIDDFRIHDRILTQAEINGIYNSGSGTEAQSSGLIY